MPAVYSAAPSAPKSTALASPCAELSRPLGQCRLIELVVKRLQTDAQLFRRFGLVAAMAIERVVDGLHLQVAERDRSGNANFGERAAAAGETLWQMIGRDR